jgi:pimeloyl-ACP methyl ester carboxylesterase
MVEATRHGLERGVDGWLDDDVAFVQPWGFELDRIARPLLIVHGDDDLFVPVAHARWLARRIAGAETWIDAADGHLTLFERRVREVNEWLLQHS